MSDMLTDEQIESIFHEVVRTKCGSSANAFAPRLMCTACATDGGTFGWVGKA